MENLTNKIPPTNQTNKNTPREPLPEFYVNGTIKHGERVKSEDTEDISAFQSVEHVKRDGNLFV